MRHAANQNPLAQDTFANGAGSFGHTLASKVWNSRENLNPVQAELAETELGGQPGRARRNSFPRFTAAHPITKIADLMDSVDKIQADSAQESLFVFVEHGEAVPLIALSSNFSRRNELAAFFD